MDIGSVSEEGLSRPRVLACFSEERRTWESGPELEDSIGGISRYVTPSCFECEEDFGRITYVDPIDLDEATIARDALLLVHAKCVGRLVMPTWVSASARWPCGERRVSRT